MPERYIVHIDMDAFFAAVEQRDNPLYQNKPVIIGADPLKGRGVVSTCSYEARKYGIASAMPISIAYRKCPNGIFLRGDMQKYQDVSQKIHRIFYDFTPDIEPISIDEAFLDITHSAHLFGGPIATCKKIKQTIKEKIGITASCGLAPVKMAAKIASDMDKPDGLVVVTQKNLLSFLWPLSIRKMWGIGPETAKKLNSLGINIIKDLAKKKPEYLRKVLGINGIHLWRLANGIDPREVYYEDKRVSISNEYTFNKDTNNSENILSVIMGLSEKLSMRMRNEKIKGKKITLKIRTEDFKTITRTLTLKKITNFTDDIFLTSKNIFKKEYNSKIKIRLIGVKISGLNNKFSQKDLFEENKENSLEKIHFQVEKIKQKHGDVSIRRASARKIF